MSMEIQPIDLDGERRASRAGRRAVATQLAASVGVVVIGLLVLARNGHEISWLAGLVAGAGAGAWATRGRAGGRGRVRVPRAPQADRRADPAERTDAAGHTDAAVKPLES